MLFWGFVFKNVLKYVPKFSHLCHDQMASKLDLSEILTLSRYINSLVTDNDRRRFLMKPSLTAFP